MKGNLPAFLVTEIKKVRRYQKPNAYTGGYDRRQEYWRVHLMDGFYRDFTFDLFYESEEEADRFSPWEVLHPKEIINTAGAMNQPFVAGEPYWLDIPGPQNLYGVSTKQRTWKVPFLGGYGGLRELEISTWDEWLAMQFRRGNPYTLLDFFGTLRSPPFDVAKLLAGLAARMRALSELIRQLKKRAQKAMQDRALDEANRLADNLSEIRKQEEERLRKEEEARKKAEEEARKKAEERQKQIDAIPGRLTADDARAALDFATDWNTQPFTADAEAKLDLARSYYDAQDYDDALAMLLRADAALAQATLRISQDEQSYARSWHPAGRGMAAYDRWWHITNGGAYGWYDGQLFPAGSFALNEGWWYGTFSRDGVNPAPPGNYSDPVGTGRGGTG